MRLSEDWPRAPTLPTTSVIAARVATAGPQLCWAASRATSKKRRNTPRAATLGATAMKAVTGVGAPSYTSGVHWWKGATEDLKARPTRHKAMPVSSSTSLERPLLEIAAAIVAKSV